MLHEIIIIHCMLRSDVSAAKRRRTWVAGELGFGHEKMWMVKRDEPVLSREHKYCKSPGVESSAAGFLQIPGCNPADLFSIPRSAKEEDT